MNDEIIKNALSYSLGSDLHEAWRATRKLDDGTFEPRIKKSEDKDWTEDHGTDTVDIANCPFNELPSNWQHENLEAARVAIRLVYDKVMRGEKITPEELEQMASVVHEEWLKRNDYVFGPVERGGNPRLALPYEHLDQKEKDKDKSQLVLAQTKVQDYKDGLIDIEQVCKQYNLATSERIK
jgi:hypothetical protein